MAGRTRVPRRYGQATVWLATTCVVCIGAVLLSSVAVSAQPAAAQPASSQAETWVRVGNDIDGEAPGDFAGQSVAMSADGSRVAIGAHLNRAAGVQAGHVRVFDFVGGGWVQVGGDIDADDDFDQAGFSVDISADGSRVAIGAIANDEAGAWAGQVRVFDLVGGGWVQVGGDINGEAGSDQSGWSLALSANGSSVAIGANLNDGAGSDAGHVRVYALATGSWVQVGGDIDGQAAGDLMGSAVSLSTDGTRVAVGATAGFNRDRRGHVAVFDLVGGVWTQVGSDIGGERWGGVGWSVSLSADGSRLAIGASDGTVAVFDLTGGVWVQVAADIRVENSATARVLTVSLADDGSRVGVGYYTPHSRFSSNPWRDNGAVQTFDLINGSWTRVGSDVNGEANNDLFARAMALSGDGSRLSVGAAANDGAGNGAGHARVFELVPQTLTCQGKFVTIDLAQGGSGWGTDNDDVMLGTNDDDYRLTGRGGNDTICGLDGDDSVNGGDGDDELSGGDGDDWLGGQAGADSIYGGSGVDRIFGDDGDDMIEGQGGSDRIWAGDGDDVVRAGSGADKVYGGLGDDTLWGMGGQDSMWGGEGNDQLQGNWQSDRLWGGPGNDRLAGAEGKDKLYGEAGDDDLFGGVNTDYLDGGDGIDTANGQRGKDNPLVVDVSGCVAETRVSC